MDANLIISGVAAGGLVASLIVLYQSSLQRTLDRLASNRFLQAAGIALVFGAFDAYRQQSHLDHAGYLWFSLGIAVVLCASVAYSAWLRSSGVGESRWLVAAAWAGSGVSGTVLGIAVATAVR